MKKSEKAEGLGSFSLKKNTPPGENKQAHNVIKSIIYRAEGPCVRAKMSKKYPDGRENWYTECKNRLGNYRKHLLAKNFDQSDNRAILKLILRIKLTTSQLIGGKNDWNNLDKQQNAIYVE